MSLVQSAKGRFERKPSDSEEFLVHNFSFSSTPQPFFFSTLHLSYLLSLSMNVFSSQGSQESEVSESIMSIPDASKKKVPICSLCGNLSTSTRVLQTHVIEAHDGPRNRIRRLQCVWCPRAFQTRKGLKVHLSTCPGYMLLSFPCLCSVCGVKFDTNKAIQLHVLDCKSWPEEEEDFSELDAQLITKTGHPATARFVNDLFEQAEITLLGGEKLYAFLPIGSSKRMGDGMGAYIRPMKRRSDRVIVDSKLELALRSHAYCSLVDIRNYKALGDKDPICTLRFSDHSKQLARSLSSLLIQSGDEVLLCLKVEVYGRRESEDAHCITKLGEPDSSRHFKVANHTRDNTQMVIIGTVRWNALVTMAVVVTSGRVIVGPHNPWFHPHAASHVWLVKNGDEDLNNNVERHTRSKFDQASSYELFAAAHPRFLSHLTMPVNLSTLWEFKSSGKGKNWSAAKLASFVFHQLLNRGRILKLDVTQRLDELETRDNCRKETTIDGILENLRRLVEAMKDEETKPVSMKVSNELRQLAEKLQGEITNINKTTITDEVKMVISYLINKSSE